MWYGEVGGLGIWGNSGGVETVERGACEQSVDLHWRAVAHAAASYPNYKTVHRGSVLVHSEVLRQA